MRNGIDFDNTIASYDAVFPSAARKMDLLPRGFRGGKKEVRSAVRALDNGEREWQRLQGQVYGRFMPDAKLVEGVDAFLLAAKSLDADIRVVSHKSVHGHFDPQRIDLRDAAREWMRERGFFEMNGFGLSVDAVHFLSTRAEKIARVGTLKIDVFIDDLPEVLSEPSFPAGVRKILFTNGGAAPDGAYETAADWHEIKDLLFSGHT